MNKGEHFHTLYLGGVSISAMSNEATHLVLIDAASLASLLDRSCHFFDMNTFFVPCQATSAGPIVVALLIVPGKQIYDFRDTRQLEKVPTACTLSKQALPFLPF